MEYWFGSLHEVFPNGTMQAKMGWKKPIPEYPTKQSFGEWAWSEAQAKGFARGTERYKLLIVGPVTIDPNQTMGKRTLVQHPKTL